MGWPTHDDRGVVTGAVHAFRREEIARHFHAVQIGERDGLSVHGAAPVEIIGAAGEVARLGEGQRIGNDRIGRGGEASGEDGGEQ